METPGCSGAEDPAAFEKLVRPYYPRIYRWALVLTGSPDDADDVTQEVVIRVYRHFGSFRGEARISTWLYRITRNVAMEMMGWSRRKREVPDTNLVRKAVDSAAAGGPAAGPMAGPAGEIDRRRLVDIVRAFFRELSGRQREVFDLVDLQGYGPAEAAEMLEIDAATARTHLHRARRAIRSRIMKHYPELMEEMER